MKIVFTGTIAARIRRELLIDPLKEGFPLPSKREFSCTRVTPFNRLPARERKSLIFSRKTLAISSGGYANSLKSSRSRFYLAEMKCTIILLLMCREHIVFTNRAKSANLEKHLKCSFIFFLKRTFAG